MFCFSLRLHLPRKARIPLVLSSTKSSGVSVTSPSMMAQHRGGEWAGTWVPFSGTHVSWNSLTYPLTIPPSLPFIWPECRKLCSISYSSKSVDHALPYGLKLKLQELITPFLALRYVISFLGTINTKKKVSRLTEVLQKCQDNHSLSAFCYIFWGISLCMEMSPEFFFMKGGTPL